LHIEDQSFLFQTLNQEVFLLLRKVSLEHLFLLLLSILFELGVLGSSFLSKVLALLFKQFDP
jgi:hypothetical protein